MNSKLVELFNLYKNLRSVQTIVQEIHTADYYVYNYAEDIVIDLIDHYVTKYNKEIKTIGKLYHNKEVIENDPEVYDRKDSEEINDDMAYIRDCLIIIGAVKSGIRDSLECVVEEVREYDE